jgi:hypothetical protein
MRETDIPKTGFTTPFGNFEFKVMPMGICGAPGTFQHLMDDTFATHITIHNRTLSFHDFLGVYLDDICIHSRTRAEHPLHLRAQAEMKFEYEVSIAKCELSITQVVY